MTLFQALLLGILQGITEFFPISSSTHLLLTRRFLGCGSEDFIFELACHGGTLLALVVFLRREIWGLLRHRSRTLLLLFIALIPLVPAYLLLRPLRALPPTMTHLGSALLITALFLFLATLWQRKRPEGAWKRREVLWIGALQSVALIPGISRSASTISCGRWLGWSAQEAVSFSFLLSIPAIGGGLFLEMMHAWGAPTPLHFHLSHLIGFASAFLIGSLTLPLALRWLGKGHLTPFACYTFLLGLTLLFL